MEHANTANEKLLHECGILLDRLQECSVNFLVEEEDKLTVDTSSPSDAIDLLTTSDNRIGLLLAEVSLRLDLINFFVCFNISLAISVLIIFYLACETFSSNVSIVDYNIFLQSCGSAYVCKATWYGYYVVTRT